MALCFTESSSFHICAFPIYLNLLMPLKPNWLCPRLLLDGDADLLLLDGDADLLLLDGDADLAT